MIIDKKFWIDENSTPPTNYIWLKEGKAWEYNKNLNKWKVLDTLNAENFIQVFNSSTEEEKNAIKEALGISSSEGGDPDAVKFTPQDLSADQKSQARSNIGAASQDDLVNIQKEEYVTVATLADRPVASASTLGKIYMVGPDANNQYDKYYTSFDGTTYSWVSAGTTEIDLTTYAKQSDLDQLGQEVDNISDIIGTVQDENIDLSQYTRLPYFVNGSGLWADVPDANEQATILVPVTAGTYKIKTEATQNIWAALQNTNLVSGAAVPFGTVNGVLQTSRQTVAADTEFEVVITENDTTHYFALRADRTSGAVLPAYMIKVGGNVELKVVTTDSFTALEKEINGGEISTALTPEVVMNDVYMSSAYGGAIVDTTGNGWKVAFYKIKQGRNYSINIPKTVNSAGYSLAYTDSTTRPRPDATMHELPDTVGTRSALSYQIEYDQVYSYLAVGYDPTAGDPTVTESYSVEGIGDKLGMKGAFYALDLSSIYGSANYHKYVSMPNGVGYAVTYNDSENSCILRVAVKEGEKYHIRSANYYSFRAWMTVDSDDKGVRICASGATAEINDTITIQPGEKELLLNIHRYGFYLVAKQKDLSIYNPIAGKLIAFDGDSICEQRLLSENSKNGGGYAYLLARKYGIDLINKGKGGATLATNSGASHSISGSLESLPIEADMYCIEGGHNDWALNVPLGTLTDGYTDAVDSDTVLGAMETIFRYCLTNFVGKPIVFVLAHKVQHYSYSQNSTGKTFQEYHDAMVKCLNKYSIPFYDADSYSGLNGWNAAQSAAFLTANSTGQPDGTHPNEAGYLKYYVGQLYEILAANVGVTLD